MTVLTKQLDLFPPWDLGIGKFPQPFTYQRYGERPSAVPPGLKTRVMRATALGAQAPVNFKWPFGTHLDAPEAQKNLFKAPHSYCGAVTLNRAASYGRERPGDRDAYVNAYASKHPHNLEVKTVLVVHGNSIPPVRTEVVRNLRLGIVRLLPTVSQQSRQLCMEKIPTPLL